VARRQSRPGLAVLGLYIHIPFCQAICSYCNFNRGLLDETLKTRYVDGLEREIGRAASDRPADTIFFGGGTPSLLEPDEVRRLVAACRDAFALAPDAEVTLEANPETVTPRGLAAFREAGVTRVSFGVQSFDGTELARLGRIHSADRARQAVHDAQAAAFLHVSLDLMYWLPGQTATSWRRTVHEAVDLDPDHVSLYLLELYPNAPLREAMARHPEGTSDPSWRQAADDEAADMYLDALDTLEAAGFEQYEISNVARPGGWSRHNLKYWQGGNWIGFGCGAHSTVDELRWRNVAAPTDYLDRLDAGRAAAVEWQRLSVEDRVAEGLFMGLRLSAGIDEGNFRARYGVEPWAQYRDTLQPLVEEGLMWRRDPGFGLTRRGMLVANEILVMFV